MADNLTNWQWESEYVDGSKNSGEQVTPGSSVLLAGPNRIELLGTGQVSAFAAQIGTAEEAIPNVVSVPLVPIGKTAMFDLRQSKTNQPIHEIGSVRPYILSEKPAFNGDLRGVLLYRDNILKRLYSWAEDKSSIWDPYKIEMFGESEYKTPVNQRFAHDMPGYDQFYGALSSRLFTVPVGIFFLMRTNRDHPYGALFLEDLVINNYLISMNSAQSMMMEMIGFDCAFVRPVKLQSYAATVPTA